MLRNASLPVNGLTLTGLHSHIGTFNLDVRADAAQARIMAEFMDKVEIGTACRIEYLDIGGGFASRNALQGSGSAAGPVSAEF